MSAQHARTGQVMRGCVVKRMSRQTPPRAQYYVKLTGSGGTRWLTDPATGAAFTRKRDAADFLARILAEARTGRLAAPSSVTVAQHAAGWLTLARGRLKPSTWTTYHSKVGLVLADVGQVPVQQLTAAHLDGLYLRLLDRGLSARTVHQVHTITKAMLEDAVRKGLLTHNPATSATPPAAAPGVQHRTWTAAELAAFLDHTAGTRHGVLWAFLALTGCRRGEALALRWDDVDDTRVLLARTVGAVAGVITTGTPKSGRGRTIALDPGLAEQLRAHRAQQTRQRMAAPTWIDHGLVFPRTDGRHQHPDTVTRAFRRAAIAAGVPPIRLHDLRHTWATLALQAGINPKVVQERLGHSSVTITLGTYSHVLPAMGEQAAATVAGMVAGGARVLDLQERIQR